LSSVPTSKTALRVDADRLRADLEGLSAIGATPEGGVSRPTFSDAHLAARAWFLERAAAVGLETQIDAAGNHSAILRRSPRPDVPTLLLGSHLDSVPGGGRFDGALGVLAALEVLRTVQEAGLEPRTVLEAIDFTDEEGTLVGLLGSQALAGTLSPDVLHAPRGGRDALVLGLERAGLVERRLAEARRDPASLAGYLELHIEQGPKLERMGVDIGIVTTIVGARSCFVVFRGRPAHSGTTPMDAREDAGIGAASFVLAAREIVMHDFPSSVATVGDVRFEPGAFNVVPGSARLALDLRSPDANELDRLESVLLAQARAVAQAHRLDLEISPVGSWPPRALDDEVRAAIGRSAQALGLSAFDLPSGAGHDAQALAPVTPSGMIFVPSVGGVSHAPGENTRWHDCVNGANVLLGTVVELACGREPGLARA
jgi:beta-ureidopropionase / N-carbamoyl-L-amino-acid hydrolase